MMVDCMEATEIQNVANRLSDWPPSLRAKVISLFQDDEIRQQKQAGAVFLDYENVVELFFVNRNGGRVYASCGFNQARALFLALRDTFLSSGYTEDRLEGRKP